MIFFDDIVEGLMRGFSGGRRKTKAESAEVGIYIRKQELDQETNQENDQEKKIFFLFFLGRFLGREPIVFSVYRLCFVPHNL